MAGYFNQVVSRRPTYHLGLIGYPLGHSRSPQLHHAALRACGLTGEYTLFPIPPLPEGQAQIVHLLGRLRGGEIQGLNVTIPHKPSVMPHLDEVSPIALAVGAVNTLYLNADNHLVGDNTDVPGFLRDVEKLTGSSQGEDSLALILGAGGSARAVVYAMARAGWKVCVLARRLEQADALVSEIGAAPALSGARLLTGLLDAGTLAQYAPDCRLVVNTTPLGMYPNNAGSPWPVGLPLPSSAVIYDLVYNPIETVLVHTARQAGLLASTGAGMLVAQAALAFARWTGAEPPYEIMEQAFEL